MTAYGGGKAKLGCHIYNVINKLIEEQDKKYDTYFEPFCGMLGVAYRFIKNDKFNKYILSDKNKDIILLWEKLKKGNFILPPPCTKEEYKKIKESKLHSALKGYYGVSCAYSGIFFAGYKVNIKAKENTQLLGNLLKQNSKKIKLICSSYTDFNPKGMVIYCDPPYKNNNFGSEYFKDFNTELFWDTIRKWSKDNLVIVSEYEAPPDFKCIWTKTTNSCFNGLTKGRNEGLFIYSN